MRHKLLLADDSVTIQRVIELTFAGEDVHVLTAGDGEEAIARVQADRPDIVLADIGMPKRSGYDVAAFIKEQPEFAHIPVLLLTGAFEPVDEGRAKAVGCDGVLVKPFEPQHVIARVRELLEGVQRRSTGLESGSATPAVADVPRPVERLAPYRAGERQEHPGIAPPRESGARQEVDVEGTEGERAASGSALDDYFDRLDAAFANIGTAGPDQAKPSEAEVVHEPEVVARHERPVGDQDLEWFDRRAEAASPDRPVRRLGLEAGPPPSANPDAPATFANPPATSFDWPAPSAVDGPAPSTLEWGMRQPQSPPPEPADLSPTISRGPEAPRAAWTPPAPSSRGAPGGPTPIADAFSALLAVEEGEAGATPVRLTTGPTAPEITDELVDEITRRVMDRLAPKAVTDVVSDIVTRVAERLVREEIARIRNR